MTTGSFGFGTINGGPLADLIAKQYGYTGYDQQQAFGGWTPDKWTGGLSPELLKGVTQQGWTVDPNSDISSSHLSEFTYDPAQGVISYHPAGQGAGEDYYLYDKNGNFLTTQKGAKNMSYAQGILAVAGAGAGFGALGAAAGGAGAAGAAGADAGAGAGAATEGGSAFGGGLGTGSATGGSYGLGTTLGGASPYTYGGSVLYDSPYAWGATAGAAGGAAGGTAAMGAGAGSGGGAGGAGGAGASSAASVPTASTGGLSSLFGGSGAGGGFNWGSLVGPALSGISGMYGANQANKAADAQLQAAKDAQAMFKPWIDNGGWAINQAGSMAGRNGPDAAKAAFMQDPGYQFRLDQGNQALTRAAAANGTFGSGKYLKDAMAYNQGQASQEFGNSYNRLLGLAGMGQTATGSSADYGTQGANAKAAGIVGGANAMTNALGQGYSMYQNNQLMNRLFPGYA